MSEVYQQVIITCTTINVFIFISALISWVGIMISDHRKKKKKDKRKQDNNQ